jgi:hypothetical protein
MTSSMSKTTISQSTCKLAGATESEQSIHPATEMLELDRSECLGLLAASGGA